MHHKRKRPRAARAGCKMCKPWKKDSASKTKLRSWRDRREEEREREQLGGRIGQGPTLP